MICVGAQNDWGRRIGNRGADRLWCQRRRQDNRLFVQQAGDNAEGELVAILKQVADRSRPLHLIAQGSNIGDKLLLINSAIF